jgi:hypothetical protein
VINGRTCKAPGGACVVASVNPQTPHKVVTEIFSYDDVAGLARFMDDVPDGHVVCYGGTDASAHDTAVQSTFNTVPPTPEPAVGPDSRSVFAPISATEGKARAFIGIKGGVVLSEETSNKVGDLVEVQHRVPCVMSDDGGGEGVHSLRRIFSYLPPDALQTLLDLIEWAKKVCVPLPSSSLLCCQDFFACPARVSLARTSSPALRACLWPGLLRLPCARVSGQDLT